MLTSCRAARLSCLLPLGLLADKAWNQHRRRLVDTSPFQIAELSHEKHPSITDTATVWLNAECVGRVYVLTVLNVPIAYAFSVKDYQCVLSTGDREWVCACVCVEAIEGLLCIDCVLTVLNVWAWVCVSLNVEHGYVWVTSVWIRGKAYKCAYGRNICGKHTKGLKDSL